MEHSNKITVLVRARPLVSPDQRPVWTIAGDTISSVEGFKQSGGTTQKFAFDSIYSPEIDTRRLYSRSIVDFAARVINGYNCTCFAYGQSCSGKTFTIFGDCLEANFIPASEGSKPGILPLCIEDLFSKLATTSDRTFIVYFSYWELYNEELKDLLADEKRRLEVRYTGNSMHIACTEKRVSSLDDVLMHLKAGNKLREVAATDLNSVSSRSHAIARLTVESIGTSFLEELIKANKLPPLETIEKFSAYEISHRTATLTIVDLAGSERQVKTNAIGDRFKEATNINKSLLTLGRVFTAITTNSAHVPYRDSNLTKILQTSLQGSCYTVMIACVSLAHEHADETLNTLRYASNASSIETKLQANEIVTDEDALIRLQTERKQLLDRVRELEQRCKMLEESSILGPLQVTSGARKLSDQLINIDTLEPALKQLGISMTDEPGEPRCLQSVGLSPMTLSNDQDTLKCSAGVATSLAGAISPTMSCSSVSRSIFRTPGKGGFTVPSITDSVVAEQYARELGDVLFALDGWDDKGDKEDTDDADNKSIDNLTLSDIAGDADFMSIATCFLPEEPCYVQTNDSKLYRPINTLDILSLRPVDEVLGKIGAELQHMYRPALFLESNMSAIDEALEGNTASCLYGMLHKIRQEVTDFMRSRQLSSIDTLTQLLAELDQAYKHSYETSLSTAINRLALMDADLEKAKEAAASYCADLLVLKESLSTDYVLIDRYKEFEARVDDLTRQVSLETAKFESTSALLKQAQSTSENMVQRLEELTGDLNNTRKEKDDLNVKIVNLKKILTQAKSGIMAIKTAYMTQRAEFVTLKREHAELMVKARKLQKYKDMVVQQHQLMEKLKENAPITSSDNIKAGRAGVRDQKKPATGTSASTATGPQAKPIVQEEINNLVNSILQQGDGGGSGVEGPCGGQDDNQLLNELLSEIDQ